MTKNMRNLITCFGSAMIFAGAGCSSQPDFSTESVRVFQWPGSESKYQEVDIVRVGREKEDPLDKYLTDGFLSVDETDNGYSATVTLHDESRIAVQEGQDMTLKTMSIPVKQFSRNLQRDSLKTGVQEMLSEARAYRLSEQYDMDLHNKQLTAKQLNF
jgi:hypothetical protein